MHQYPYCPSLSENLICHCIFQMLLTVLEIDTFLSLLLLLLFFFSDTVGFLCFFFFFFSSQNQLMGVQQMLSSRLYSGQPNSNSGQHYLGQPACSQLSIMVMVTHLLFKASLQSAVFIHCHLRVSCNVKSIQHHTSACVIKVNFS